MDIEQYLQSEQAAMDVATLLATSEPIQLAIHSPFVVGQLVESWLCRTQAGAWGCIFVGDRLNGSLEMRAVAYYRPSGDRYIVTDLGEALRAYALRSGEYGGPGWQPYPLSAAMAAAVSCWPAGSQWRDGAIWADGDERSTNPHFGTGIPAADLPRAICHVMLAAYRVSRVSRLEVPR